MKGDGLALETSGLNDNWDDAEGYYCKYLQKALSIFTTNISLEDETIICVHLFIIKRQRCV